MPGLVRGVPSTAHMDERLSLFGRNTWARDILKKLHRPLVFVVVHLCFLQTLQVMLPIGTVTARGFSAKLRNAITSSSVQNVAKCCLCVEQTEIKEKREEK